MMDHKTWLWKKRATEKTMVESDKVNLSLGGHEEETLQNEKAELERDLKILSEKLSSALTESNAKDDIAKRQAKMAQEAIAGWEKAEAEAISLKQELDKAIQQRVAGEERAIGLDAALKECMQQLRFVREEQEKRIHDALIKTSREFEKTRILLEEKLAETSKRLAKLDGENNQLGKALLGKEKVIQDLNDHRARAEADFSTLMTKLNSKEKESAALKYEVRVLEKELEIRNEEREFNRRTADVAHKQHLESVKKIAKLESDCQRLRLLVRKRLPGPAALAKMKSEVEILGKDPLEPRRRKSNSSSTGSMDFSVNALDTPNKRISFLTEQLYAMEEENRALKETLNGKTNELQFSRSMDVHTASELSQVKAQLEEPSNGQTTVGPEMNLHTPRKLSLASLSEMGSDEKFSCAESWASLSISELEQVGKGKQTGTPCKTVGASDINLMDDFIEMEKFAIVSVNKPFGNSHLVSKEISAIGWLDDIVKMVSEQTRVTQRNPDEILEEIKVALTRINHPNPNESVDSRQSSNHPVASNPLYVNDYISEKPPDKSSIVGSSDRFIGNNISSAKSNQQVHSELSISIGKIIELIDGISLPSLHYDTSETLYGKDSEMPTDYMVRVFQWKNSDLSGVLHKFVQTCNDLLNGKADLENFAEELTSALEWIVNHCFSIQDVSSMRDAVKKHFDWDETQSESEVEGGMINQISEADRMHVPKEHIEECRRLKDELANIESEKKDLELKLQSQIGKSASLTIRLRESEKSIESLQTEIEILKHSKGMVEDQIKSSYMVKEDLDTQLTMAKVELNEAYGKKLYLEEELRNKNNCCQELEEKCLELQLQLESLTKKEIPNHDIGEQEKQLQNDWEITAASEKLAECQETILNLGKQLKSLASPREAALFDKVVSTPSDAITTTTLPEKNNKKRSTLLDKMLAEDNAQTGDLRSPKTKEIISVSKSPAVSNGNYGSAIGLNGAINTSEMLLNLNRIKRRDEDVVVNSLAIVPSKKKGGGGLLRKLLPRRNKGNSKKNTLPICCMITKIK